MGLKNISRELWAKLLDYTPSNIGVDVPNVFVIYVVARIGDGVASSIIWRSLRKQYPQSNIIIVCSEYNRSVFEFVPDIHLYVVKKGYFSAIKNAIVIRSRFRNVDYLFSLGSAGSTAALVFMRFLHSRVNVSLRETKLKMLNHLVPMSGAYDSFESIKSQYQKVVRSIGIKEPADRFSFFLNSESDDLVCEYLGSKWGVNNYVAVNLFGFDKHRQFDRFNALQLLQKLEAEQYRLVLLCSPATVQEVSFLCSELKGAIYYPLTENIHDSAAIVKYARCLISPDTSLVHIASAFNVPTIAIYTDEFNSITWPPFSSKKEVVLCKDINDVEFDVILGVLKAWGC